MRLPLARLRPALFLAAAVLLMCPLAARAQEPPPKIPFFVLDLQGAFPRFPGDQQLADSRGMNLAELPGPGLGLQAGLHIYPVRWKAITFGIGGEVTANRSRQTPDPSAAGVLRPAEEKFLSAAPQLSFNFGTGHGWSYLSGGVGVSQWSVIPEGQEPLLADTARLKTVNYGGGARWFMKSHLAFSFDVRFYAINPTPGELGYPPSPRTTMVVIGAGISVK
jgi:hypothetical protein